MPRSTCGSAGSHQACRRFELLTQIEPYDHEIRYSFAQSLKLAGDAKRARTETELAARLRKEHDQIVQLRYKILKDPNDLESRFEVAKWMLEHGHADEGLKWTREILRANPITPRPTGCWPITIRNTAKPAWRTIIASWHRRPEWHARHPAGAKPVRSTVFQRHGRLRRRSGIHRVIMD